MYIIYSTFKQLGEEDTILYKTQRFVENNILRKDINKDLEDKESAALIGEMKNAFHMFTIHMQGKQLYSTTKNDYFSTSIK